MTSRIAVVADSSCDLPAQLRERHSIHIVPLIVRFGEEVYNDGELSGDAFWKLAESRGVQPKTSQPPVGQFEEVFSSLVSQGCHVLCLVVTSKHSGTYNSAYAAAQSFPGHVTVFDSGAFSLCHGYQAIVAARAAAEGRTLQDILALLEGIRSRTRIFMCLDTIEYLRRGGRADQVIPAVEKVMRVLHIKPLLDLREGQLQLLGAARSYEKALERLRQETAQHAPPEMLFALHTHRGDAIVEFAHQLAGRLGFPAEKVMVGEVGAVLSCHAGPGATAAAIVRAAT